MATTQKEPITEREMMQRLQELIKGDPENARLIESALDILKETRFDGLSYQFREFLWAVRRLAAGECLHLDKTYKETTQFHIIYKCDKCGEEIKEND